MATSLVCKVSSSSSRRRFACGECSASAAHNRKPSCSLSLSPHAPHASCCAISSSAASESPTQLHSSQPTRHQPLPPNHTHARTQQCDTLLANVAEAQRHNEVTGHSQFEESTQKVPRLVCTDCGKVCRSEVEKAMHSRGTGHSSYEDKVWRCCVCLWWWWWWWERCVMVAVPFSSPSWYEREL